MRMIVISQAEWDRQWEAMLCGLELVKFKAPHFSDLETAMFVSGIHRQFHFKTVSLKQAIEREGA
ncbi:hypothetical protein LCGC14_1179830 [marine sediment metagenome]|uniref:Uncharacterized protein n=1 Tax=marine sediment metagenome TaxID=412755 RepID=A0A0F9MAA7_9ZZZZ